MLNVKKHYLMTVLALVYLGVIISRPGDSFQAKEKSPVFKLDDKGIYYQYE